MALTGYLTSAWSVESLTALINSILGANDFAGATITTSTIDSSAIGGTVPAAGAFTTLTASNTVTLSPVSHNVVLSPSGTGVVTINPATAGTLDNVAIGATTAAAGKFTTLNASGAASLTGTVSLTNASVSMTAIPTADPHVVGRVWANSGVLTISAG